MNVEIWERVGAFVGAGQLDFAAQFLESTLITCTSQRFRGLIGHSFSNSPSEIAKAIDSFVRECGKTFDVQAIYLEMNGFDINPDRWYFDFFGYTKFSDDPNDLGWLGDWVSDDWPAVTLTGFEAVQSDFDWYSNHQGYKDPLAKEAAECATLLVMIRYVSLIEAAVKASSIQKGLPIFATAHDFDIVARCVA